MFKFNVEEELSCKIEGSGKFYAKKGAMVAFKGNFKFDERRPHTRFFRCELGRSFLFHMVLNNVKIIKYKWII